MVEKERIIRSWASNTRHQHKSKGFDVRLLSLDDLVELAKKSERCFICDCKIDWFGKKRNRANPRSPTVDREKNGIVLTSNNVNIVCLRCNASKYDRTLKEFVRYCSYVHNKFSVEKRAGVDNA